MGADRWERWAPLSGVVFVVLCVAGFAIGVSGAPEGSDSDQEFLSYYADSANRAKEITAFFLFVVAALFLICFVGALRNRLRSVESEPKGLSALAFGAGVASTMVASVLVAATSVLALRTAVLPRWLGWVGIVVALALLVAVFFIPVFLFWAWVLVVAVVLAVRTPSAQSPHPERAAA
jgi:MFS family permease